MKKRILAGLLVLCMVLALGLTACQNTTATTTAAETTTKAEEEKTTTTAEEETTTAAEGEDTTTTEATQPATWENLSWEKDTSPVTFSAYIDYDWYAVDTWGNDDVSKEITRLTGVSLDVYKSSDRQQLMTQLAAMELSDFTFTDNMPQRFEDPDICYRWDELIQEHCPEFWDLVDPLEKINNQAADGHVYTFKTHYKDDADYNDEKAIGNFTNAAIGYRLDIMDKLGLKMFTSVEEMEETFYTVKEKSADVGIEIVFNMHPSWAEILSYWMGAQQGNYWDAEAKSIKMKYNDTAWLEYYKLLNKWYRDGILAKDYLAVRPEDFFARNASGSVFAMSYNWGIPSETNNTMREAGTGGHFDDLTKPVFDLVVGPLTYKGENNLVKTATDYGTGWSSLFIAKSCENPGRAINYAEFLKSPFGDRLTQWGIEGTHYTLVDGYPKTTAETAGRPSTETGIGPWYFQGSDRSEGIKSASELVSWDSSKYPDDAKHEAEQKVADRKIKKEACRQNKNPAMGFARIESADDEMGMYTKINEEWTKAVANMVSAESEAAVETAWNDFQKYAADAGLTQVEAKMTSRYVENLTRYQEQGYFTDIVVK